ncbi:MAG: hypothetical protein F6K26_35655 [Moorea sp. SIO2I5]|nr:hypothetical protein [Moorena sp. SIO2I5]
MIYNNKNNLYFLLFPIPCSLFPTPYSLLPTPYLSRVCFLDLGIRLGITQQKYILKPKPQEGFENSIKIIK